MLDINLVRNEPDSVRNNLKKKFRKDLLPLVDEVLKLDKEWRELKNLNDKDRKKRNELSKEIAKAKKEGKDPKKIMAQAKAIPGEIKCREEAMSELHDKIRQHLMTLPNIIDESVKIGKDDSENVQIKTWGKPTKPDFKLLSNGEIAEKLGLADFESASHVAGSGFYYIMGDLALLNQALIKFAIDHMTKKGFTYVETPLMLKQKPYEGMVPMEDFEETLYKIDNEDLYMIATSEHSLTTMFMDKILSEETMPIKIVGYSMCFRKEVGSHGLDEKGLFRTHQFNKVEQIVICKPEDSKKIYDEMLKNTEELFQALELPYQVLDLCSGDLNSVKHKSCDIEVWMPRGQTYREVTSLTNCTDYQARRLNLRIEDKHKNKTVPHTLNNTVVATSRAMVAILENYQNKDGSVSIPKALQPYMDGKKKLEPLKKFK